MFLNIFKHLLPNALAWQLTPAKQLREFFDGLSNSVTALKTFVDEIWSDIDPAQTRQLNLWETQFGLRNVTLTEQERRNRLDAAWKAVGGQDPRYIQDTLQGAGFNVFIHEWWEPGTEPAINSPAAATPRDPTLIIGGTGRVYIPECGEAVAECGEVLAEAGNTLSPPGYPLVNKDGSTYVVSATPAEYPYYLYIGAEIFPTSATIDAARRDEFEALCLKICPLQQWLGILVTYA